MQPSGREGVRLARDDANGSANGPAAISEVGFRLWAEREGGAPMQKKVGQRRFWVLDKTAA